MWTLRVIKQPVGPPARRVESWLKMLSCKLNFEVLKSSECTVCALDNIGYYLWNVCVGACYGWDLNWTSVLLWCRANWAMRQSSEYLKQSISEGWHQMIRFISVFFSFFDQKRWFYLSCLCSSNIYLFFFFFREKHCIIMVLKIHYQKNINQYWNWTIILTQV